MKHKKPKRKQTELYLLNEDIEKLHERYEQLFKQVKTSLNLSENQIEKECDILSRKYDFEIEELSLLREVDYEIKLAEIEQRRRVLKPWRRCWLWRLLFKPLTNRAQDIIEARAELEADKVHSAAEKAIDDERKKLQSDSSVKKPSKREMLEKLQKAIEEADNADFREALDEPGETSEKETLPRGCTTAEPQKQEKPGKTAAAAAVQEAKTKPQDNGQLPGQITLDDVQKLQPPPERRPRPPRSCRKSAT